MIEARLDLQSVEKLRRKLARISPERRGNVVAKGFRKSSLLLEAALKKNVSGPILKVRTGRLRASIGSRVISDSGNMAAVIGSGVRGQNKRVVYANIHETGGIIRPKRGKYLAIPQARTAGGDVSVRSGGSIRLVRQVKIPARKYLSKTLRASRQRVIDTLNSEIDKGLRA